MPAADAGGPKNGMDPSTPIREGMELSPHPSLRTGRADLPHPALRWVCHPRAAGRVRSFVARSCMGKSPIPRRRHLDSVDGRDHVHDPLGPPASAGGSEAASASIRPDAHRRSGRPLGSTRTILAAGNSAGPRSPSGSPRRCTASRHVARSSAGHGSCPKAIEGPAHIASHPLEVGFQHAVVPNRSGQDDHASTLRHPRTSPCHGRVAFRRVGCRTALHLPTPFAPQSLPASAL